MSKPYDAICTDYLCCTNGPLTIVRNNNIINQLWRQWDAAAINYYYNTGAARIVDEFYFVILLKNNSLQHKLAVYPPYVPAAAVDLQNNKGIMKGILNWDPAKGQYLGLESCDIYENRPFIVLNGTIVGSFHRGALRSVDAGTGSISACNM